MIQERPKPLYFRLVDVVIGHQVRHQRRRVAREKAVEQLADHRRSDRILADRGLVDEVAILDPVGNNALVFHLTEHGRNGCRCQAALVKQRLVDLGHRCLVSRPKHLHDGVLQLSECVFAHRGLLELPR